MNTRTSIEAVLSRGPRTAGELVATLKISPATLSRAVAAQSQVVRMGRARATRYGLREAICGLPAQSFPVSQVNPDGEVHAVGELTPIVGGDFWYEDLVTPSLSRVYESLPWFLSDMRPQGYLGRGVVQAFTHRGWPNQSSAWTDRHVLAAAALGNGYNSLGDLLVGEIPARLQRENKAARWSDDMSPVPPASAERRAELYREAVTRAADDAPHDSSVDGEQPKFLVDLGRGSARRSLIVKFSAPLTQAEGRRWADLMCMEAIALETIQHELGIASASANYLSCGERGYIEVERFDRTPEGGRFGAVSLTTVDAEFAGVGRGWTQAFEVLARDGHVPTAAVSTIRRLEMFGELIGNNDRHFGNLVLQPAGEPLTFTVGPIYDFLPMWYAPTRTGMRSEVLDLVGGRFRRFGSGDADADGNVIGAALAFWERCATDDRISPEMRSISAGNAEVIAEISDSVAPGPG